VYSLGVVLYELLSGVLPYRAAAGVRPTLVEVLETLGHGELPRVSEGAPAKLRVVLAGDLDTITAKALRLAPDDRYASVKHLADDLQRFSNGDRSQRDVRACGIRCGLHLRGIASQAAWQRRDCCSY
jgi:serine/threonine-protein kinase